MTRPPTRPPTMPPRSGGDLGDSPIRPSAEAALADAAPSAKAAERKANPMLVIGIMVAAVLVGAWLLMQAMGGDRQPTTEVAAPVAPVGPQTFRVTSEPAGAAIAIDGTATGLVTPADVPLSGTTPKQVTLTLDGHDPLTADIAAADLEAGTKAYELQVAEGPTRLTISAPFAFELVRGSSVISQSATSHTVTLNPDGGTVSARNADLLLNQRVNVNYRRESQTQSLDAPGTLTVFAANEQCTVFADGRELGYPPITAHPASTGSHRIELRCPDGTTKTDTGTVRSGQDTRVTFPAAPEDRHE